MTATLRLRFFHRRTRQIVMLMNETGYEHLSNGTAVPLSSNQHVSAADSEKYGGKTLKMRRRRGCNLMKTAIIVTTTLLEYYRTP